MTPNDCYMNHLHRLQLSIKSVAPKTLIFSHVSLMQGRADSLGFFLQGISISIFRLFVWSGGGGDLWGSTWITGIIENIQVPAEILKESQVERKKIAIKSGERKRKRKRERKREREREGSDDVISVFDVQSHSVPIGDVVICRRRHYLR